MRTTRSEPTHSRSCQVDATPPPHRGQEEDPSAPLSPPPPQCHCHRAAERHPQAERNTQSPALLALRMHLLDRNKLNTRVQMRALCSLSLAGIPASLTSIRILSVTVTRHTLDITRQHTHHL